MGLNQLTLFAIDDRVNYFKFEISLFLRDLKYSNESSNSREVSVLCQSLFEEILEIVEIQQISIYFSVDYFKGNKNLLFYLIGKFKNI